jgi:tRNA(Arg) A34 adenosine deaminase TadA
MEFAFKEAEHAYKRKEVPVGAVVVHENRIIGRGYNQTETLRDPTAHAEIIAITAAARLALYVGQPVSTLLWSFIKHSGRRLLAP